MLTKILSIYFISMLTKILLFFLGFHWHVRRRIIFLISPASFAFSLPFGQNVSVEGWTVPKSLASAEICGMQSPNLRSVWQLSNYIRLKKKVILCTCCCMIMSLVRNMWETATTFIFCQNFNPVTLAVPHEVLICHCRFKSWIVALAGEIVKINQNKVQ